jgi:hypothetical protein
MFEPTDDGFENTLSKRKANCGLDKHPHRAKAPIDPVDEFNHRLMWGYLDIRIGSKT